MNDPTPTQTADTSTLSYAGPLTPRPAPRWPWRLALATLLVTLTLLAVTLFPSPHPHGNYRRTGCQSNMRQIGLAILMYTNDNGRDLPDTLNRVLATQDITPATFVCPGSKLSGLTSTTRAVDVTDLTPGGHSSYIYVGAGLRQPLGRDVVILFESALSHHNAETNGSGMNVLFGDGRAEWVSGPALGQILNQAAASARPVTWPPRGPRE
jgi:prepilin-type processing-associated H-X9-DG protein